MEEIVIREAKVDEWEVAMELAFRVFLKFEAREYGQKGTEAFAEFVTSESLRKLFIAGHYKVFIALCDEKIVGVTSVRNLNHISLLFVDAAYHRCGIGTALIDYVADYLLDNKLSQEMTVNSSPYAIDFYHVQGFTDTDGQIVEDGIIYTPMKRFLS